MTGVLDNQHISDMAEFQKWIGDKKMTPTEFVELLFEKLIDWASEPRWMGSGFTRIAMELAHLHGHPARKSTSKYKAAIESWIAQQFKNQNVTNAEQLARQIHVLIEGSMCLTLIHGDNSYITSAALAAQKLTFKHN